MADPVLLECQLSRRIEDRDITDEAKPFAVHVAASVGFDARPHARLERDEGVSSAEPLLHAFEALELLPDAFGRRADQDAAADGQRADLGGH